ncbi:MAG TPA: efflux RND transporter periplasmic adaptor subunit [Sphingomonas sp.]|jgi:RND family efflux transporter MFP subunit|uniref:efflux RND transporter periplasmic adaptor subunit n=1 Tax=Sphingomonas sp. TaxID=28214 RepID=UPI002EDB5A1C
MRRVVTLLMAGGLSLLLASCGEKDASRPDLLVATIVVQEGTENGRSLTGEVRARYDAMLSFRVGGQIVARPVRLGQTVRRGQVLARIDASDLSLAAEQATAQAAAAARQVVAAKAAATRAAADEARLRPLVGAGGIAPQQYDAVRAASDTAAAELAAARLRLAAAGAGARVAGNQRRYASLIADADGVVMELVAAPGQVVSPGQPIVRLARSGERDAVIAVPEALRASLPQTATAQVYDGGAFPATLRELSAAADPRTRTFEARYALGHDGATAPIGSTVTLRFAGRERASRPVALPIGALVDRGAGTGVWLIQPNRTVAFHRIGIASMDAEKALVTGLPAGHRVVALGAHLLSAGQRVRLGGLPK